MEQEQENVQNQTQQKQTAAPKAKDRTSLYCSIGLLIIFHAIVTLWSQLLFSVPKIETNEILQNGIFNMQSYISELKSQYTRNCIIAIVVYVLAWLILGPAKEDAIKTEDEAAQVAIAIEKTFLVVQVIVWFIQLIRLISM